MTIRPLLERIQKISGLAGRPINDSEAVRVVRFMMDHGTIVPQSERLNLAALGEAIEAIDRADRERWARERAHGPTPTTASGPATR